MDSLSYDDWTVDRGGRAVTSLMEFNIYFVFFLLIDQLLNIDCLSILNGNDFFY